MAAKLDTVAYIVKFFANEAGRDKFNKIVQYGARLLAYELRQFDPKSDLAARMAGLFAHTRDTRKLVRWFKQFSEIQKLQALFKQPSTLKQQLSIVGAAGLFIYWTFDNLLYLANSKTLTKDANWAKASMFGWWLGITTAMYIDGMTLAENFAKEPKLRESIAVLNSSNSKSESAAAAAETKAKLEKELYVLLVSRKVLYLNFVKNTGDWIVSSAGWELPQRLGLSPVTERVASVSGLVSGLVVAYQVVLSL